MEDKKYTVADAIMTFLDRFEGNMGNNDYERGIQLGLVISLQLAEEVERNA